MNTLFPASVPTPELRLALVPGIGPRLRQKLLSHFGSSQAVLRASQEELLRVDSIGVQTSRAIVAARGDRLAEETVALCQRRAIQIVLAENPNYPRLLREIPDPPCVLYLHGRWDPRDNLAIAIVGTRQLTGYGRRQAHRLAGELATAGMTIVSGLARGIDAAAHRGALEAKGRTIAVLGSGLLNIYPPEHRKLASEIRESGALISELPPYHKPSRGMFPQRNRIITGLCLGVVVIEAAEQSGALISARHGIEQGREVFAMPGPVDHRTSRGCHRLLREGARLVESASDVLDELGPLVAEVPQSDGRVIRHPAELRLNQQEQAVLNAIGTSPTYLDTIVTQSQLPAHRVLSTIGALEIRQLVERLSGQRVIRR